MPVPAATSPLFTPAIRDPQKVSMSKTLSSLIQEGHPLISIQTVDEPRAEFMRDARLHWIETCSSDH